MQRRAMKISAGGGLSREARRGRGRRLLSLLGVISFGLVSLGAVGTFQQDSGRKLSQAERRENAAERLVNADSIRQQIRITRDRRTGVWHALINGKEVTSKNIGEIERAAQQNFPGLVIEFIDKDTERLLSVMPRTMLGVIVEPITGLAASQLRIPEGRAIVLEKVFRGLPAAEASLRQYDIILACNGQAEMTKPMFTKILTGAEPGDHLNLVILRGGQEYELQVKLEKYDPIRSRQLGAQQTTRQLNAGNVASMEALIRSFGNADQVVGMSGLNFGEADRETIFFEIEGNTARLPDGLQRIRSGRVGTIELIHENEELHRELKVVSVKLDRLEELLKMLLVARFGETEVDRRLEALPRENVNSEGKDDR